MIRIFLLAIGVLCSLTTAAQFSDSVHYYAKYASTGSINQTNDGRAYLLNNVAAFKVSKKKISLNADAAYVYGAQNGAQTNNDVSAGLNFNIYRTNRRFYYWGLATYDRSYSLKVNNRAQAGLGVAYDILRTPTAMLNVSDGPLFEYSDLIRDDTIPEKYQTVRNSLRVMYKFTIHNIVVLEGSQFWQQSLLKGDDYILKSVNSVSVKLRSWLAITTALNYNRINRTGRENLLVNYGITLEKYF
ncbi:DUF481 domain-containing protein [Chitinophaga sedimenti]|uniref:DUF481 domain-containing protein n=1 Tax=Chitinophaga sedimenti TaxID=2033606 RepID=UPI0020062996|nr:DUF481 domain-containing protein [Chitinophaga sedimenti]MCK7555540.1 DUF481 domain-containing protein [Chitinophaga sedimenti]